MGPTRTEEWKTWLDKYWPAIDRQVGKAQGLPKYKSLSTTRKRVWRELRKEHNMEDFDPLDPTDKDAMDSFFRKVALPMAETDIQWVKPLLAEMPPETAIAFMPPKTQARIARATSARKRAAAKAQAKRPRRRQKEDADNLGLLSFVVERTIPFFQLFEEALDTRGNGSRLRSGHHGPKIKLPLAALADEWNRTHPRWPMSSGEVFMAQFYKAVRRPHLVRAFLSDFTSEFEEELARVQEDARKVATFPEPPEKESHRWTDRLTQREREQYKSTGPDDWNAWVKQEAQRVHDNLTRRELVGRVTWHVALAMAGLRGEDRKQAFTRPLRYWFLDEAYGRAPELDGDGYLPIPPEVWEDAMRRGIRRQRAELAAKRSARTSLPSFLALPSPPPPSWEQSTAEPPGSQ